VNDASPNNDHAFPQAGLDREASEIYRRSGIGTRVGHGSRPALVVVDLQNGFTDPASACGGNLDEVVAAAARLLEAARAARLPVAFTAVAFHRSLRDGATWLRKMPGLDQLVEGSAWCQVDDRVRPRDDEPMWEKRAPSAFFGTPLLPFLIAEGVDTLVVCGCVTSGCVRATVVDAVSYGYRTVVPLEAVGDRAARVHDGAIFDMDAKYADVEPLEDVIARLAPVPDAAAPAP
jgi:nicotinamidase-related amidase